MVAVYKDGEYRVAQYGQWDGYPSGQGTTILKFLRDELRRPGFDEAVLKTRWITGEETEIAWATVGVTDGTFTMEQHDAYKKKFPQLHRDTGANILALIQDLNTEVALDNALGFAADSLFCEWAYVIDLDNNTFEVFKGFNKEALPHTERFAFLEPVDVERRKNLHGETYYPVRFIRKYSLSDLPTEEQFLSDLEPRDEEE